MSWISSSQTLIINYCDYSYFISNQPSNKQKVLHSSRFLQGRQLVHCKVSLFHAEYFVLTLYLICLLMIFRISYMNLYHINYMASVSKAYLVDRLVVNSSSGNIKGRHKNTNKNRCNTCRSSCSDKPVAVWHCCIYESFCISKTCKLTSTSNSHTKDLTTGTTI